MGYKKAEAVLPKELLDEIQKYIEGEYIYIPKSTKKSGWGEKSGTREELVRRNKEIRRQFEEGTTIQTLSDSYHLSINTIKKIVYSRKG